MVRQELMRAPRRVRELRPDLRKLLAVLLAVVLETLAVVRELSLDLFEPRAYGLQRRRSRR